MNNLFKLGLVAAVLTAAGSASAATYSFSGAGTGSGFGNTRTSGDLTVTGVSDTGAGGALESAYVGYYSGSLGNTNRDTTDDNGTGSPNHAVDNSGNQDALLLSFGSGPVNLSSFSLGWAREMNGATTIGNQADVAVLAFTGGSFFNPLGFSYSYLLSNGWSLIGEYSNVLQGGTQSTGTAVNSSYWMVAAAGGAFGSTLAGYSDYFKLSAITASPCTPGTPGCGGTPGGSVPAPGSLALVGAALLGLARTRRRADA